MLTLEKADFSGIDAKIRDVIKYTKEEPAKIIKQEARLLCVELAKYTQPFGVDDKAKKLGEGAVIGDLLGGNRGGWAGVVRAGIFYVLPDGIANLSRQEKAGMVRIFSRKDGTVFGTDNFRWAIHKSISELEEHHNSQKNPNGTYGNEAGGRTVDTGRWRFIQRWVITQSQYNALLKVLIEKVGFAKSGWATCAKQLGGTKGIQKWVTKHEAPGTVIDGTTNENPFVTIRNEINYTSKVLSESGVSEALRDREIKLTARIKSLLSSKWYKMRNS